MFIDAQEKKYSNEFSFFLLLKLIYKNGKCRLNSNELLFIEFARIIKSRKTTKKHITFLQKIGWIKYNKRTKYYILKSFDNIRKDNYWEVRLAYPINYKNYYKIKAVTGAVIYGYLHKDFWRKVKKRKSVLIMGSTYHSPSYKYNYKEQLAPVSVNGVAAIFNISKATASRLKNEALHESLIVVKKNYSKKTFNKEIIKKCLNFNDQKQTAVFYKGEYHLQLIDTVYPLFQFVKRNSLKT